MTQLSISFSTLGNILQLDVITQFSYSQSVTCSLCARSVFFLKKRVLQDTLLGPYNQHHTTNLPNMQPKSIPHLPSFQPQLADTIVGCHNITKNPIFNGPTNYLAGFCPFNKVRTLHIIPFSYLHSFYLVFFFSFCHLFMCLYTAEFYIFLQ